MFNKFSSFADENAADISARLFDYLRSFKDNEVMEGQIPLPKDDLKNCVGAFNRLMKFSRNSNSGAFRVLNRNLVEALDKKTYTYCMQEHGGDLLDTLCDIVNEENQNRTPSVKIKGGATASSLNPSVATIEQQ